MKQGSKQRKHSKTGHAEKEKPENSAEGEIFGFKGLKSKETQANPCPFQEESPVMGEEKKKEEEDGKNEEEEGKENQAVAYAREFIGNTSKGDNRFLAFLGLINKVNTLETQDSIQCLIPSSWYYEEFVRNYRNRKVASFFSNQELLEKMLDKSLKKEDYELVSKPMYLFLETACGGGPIIELPPGEATFDFFMSDFRTNLLESLGLTDNSVKFDTFLMKYLRAIEKKSGQSNHTKDQPFKIEESSSSTVDTFEVGPNLPIIGIKNNSVHCFLNSVLQALISTPDFVSNALAVRSISYSVNKKGPSNSFVLEFSNFTKDYLLTKKKSGDNQAVLKMLPKYMRKGQQDAHECLTAVLSGLQEELNAREHGKRKHVEFKTGDDADEYFSKFNSSFVDRLFMGRYTATFECSSCKKQSMNFDPFYDMSLSISANDTKKLIQDYFTKEKVKYKCEACKKSTTATKTLKIARLPKILVLHIKRFVYKPEMQKIDNEIEFSRTIDLRPYFFYFFS
jgi:ubiquitin C-terminal hydrolase